MAQAIQTHHKDIPPGRMTFDEFMQWADEDTNAEWVDGEVVWMSPVSLDSGDVTHFLSVLMRMYAEHYDLGSVYSERVLMRLATRPSGREPDVVFVAKQRRAILKKTFIDGPADLVIEVIGEESRTRDRLDKYQEYERAGVREYWIVDPENRSVDFYQLDANGKFAPIPPDGAGVYHCAAIHGMWLKVDWLFHQPLPTVMSVLREWKIV